MNAVCRGFGLALAILFTSLASAQQGPQNLNVSGGLFLPTGQPVTNNVVNFRLEIWDKTGACMLYTEEHLGQDLSASKGGFSLPLGKGSSASNLMESSGVLSAKIFQNNGVIAGGWTNCPSGANLASGDERLVRVYYNLGAGFVAMSPDVPIASAAYAMVAESLQGKQATDFIQVKDDATTHLNQSNIESIFDTANFARLQQLLNPTAAIGFSSQRLSNISDPSAAQDAATKNYTDSRLAGQTIDLQDVAPGFGGGKVLTWDQAANKWVAQAPTALGVAGGDLTGSFPNPSVANLAIGTSKLADDAVTSAKINSTGIATNRILITDSTTGATVTYANCANDEILKYVTGTGWQCATVASLSAVTSVAGKTGAVTLNAMDINGLGTAAVHDVGIGATEIPILDALGKLAYSTIPLFQGDVTGAIDNNVVTRIQGYDVASTLPNLNEVLRWNGSRWEPQVIADNGITALTGDISAAGNGSVVATLTNGVVTTPKMFTNPGINRLVATDSSSGATLTAFACNLDEIMQWTASGWACVSVSTAMGGSVILNDGNSFAGPMTIGTNNSQHLFFETNGSPSMTVTASGNVGVGTTSPNRLFEVAGPMRLQPSALPGSPGAGDLVVDSGSSNVLKYHNGTNWVSVANSSSISGSTGYLAQFTSSGTVGNSPVFINSGNAGFGTSTPGEKLEVAGNIAVGSGDAIMLNGSSGSTYIKRDTVNNGLALATGSTTRLFVGDNSFVGIGTTAPNRLLEVSGPIRVQPSALPGSPAAGDIAMDSGAANSLKYHNGTTWVTINTGSGFAAAGANSDITSLNALTNINGASLAIGNSATTTLNLGGAATGALTTTVGSGAGASSTTVQSGTGGLTLSAAGTGVVTSTKPVVVTPGTLPAGNTAGMIAFDSAASNTLKFNNGTSWTSVGNTDSSGTANYLSKFNGTSSLVNSALYESAGNVGVGTTSPNRQLDVAGPMRIAPAALPGSPAAGDLAFDSGSGNTLKFHNGANWVTVPSAADVSGTTGYMPKFVTASSIGDSPVFVSGSNVGIGTTAPANMLVIGGNQAGNAGLEVVPGSGVVLQSYNRTAGSYSSMSLDALSYAFRPSGTTAMTITSTGLVGVGTSAPVTTLDVNGSIRAVSTNTAGSQFIAIGEAIDNSTPFYIQRYGSTHATYPNGVDVWNATNGILRFGTNGTERMRIDSSGNVGIGTSSPNRLLEVAGAIRIQPGALPGSPGAGDIAMDSGAANTLKFHNGTNWVTINTGSGFAAAGANSDITSLNALTNINGASLAIGNSATTTLNLGGAATGALTTTLGSNSSSSSTTVQSGTGGLTLSAAGTGVVTSNRPVVVTPTSLPAGNTAGMIAFDSAASNTLKFNNGTSWTTVGNTSASGSANYISKFNGTASLVNSALYETGGNVGVGTTSPNRLLEVGGPVRIAPATLPGSPAAGDLAFDSGNGNTLKFHNGATWVTVPSAADVSGTTGYMPKFVTASSIGNSPLFVSGSNVGIGTTSPGSPLVVYRASASSGNILVDSNGSASTTGVDFGDGAGGRLGYVGLRGTGSAAPTPSGLSYYVWSDHSSAPMILGTNNAERVRITTGGSVGIGTTSPNRLLEVAGAIRIQPGALPGSPGAGDIAMDSGASNSLKFHNGTNWVTINTGSGFAAAGANSDITSLNALTNINGASLAIGNTATTTLNLGGAATGALTTTVGSISSSSSTTVQSGTGGLTLSAAGTGVVTSNRPVVVTPTSLPAGNTAGMIAFDSAASNTLKFNNGTSWTTVGNTSASGSANYISKFNGTASLVNSALYESGGNIGVGTTSPNRQLDVAGPMRIAPAALPGSPAAGDLAFDSGNGNTLKFHNGATWVTVPSAADVSGTTGYMPKFVTASSIGNSPVFVSGSNVGIGTTSPNRPLSVYLSAATPQIQIADGVSNYSSFQSSGGNFYLNAGEGGVGGSILFRSGSGYTNTATLSAAGNFGIGTTSPNRLLEVAGPIRIQPGTLPASPAAGDIALDSGASNTLKFHNGTNWVTLNTGSGYAAAGANSDITSLNALTAINGASIAIGNSATTSLNLGSSATGALTATFGSTASSSSTTVQSGTGGLTLSAAGTGVVTSTRPLVVTPGSLPAGNTGGMIAFDSAASNSLKFNNGTSWVTVANSANISGTTGYVSQFTSGSAVGNSPMFVSGGNVGIGNTSPNRLLEVSGPVRIAPGALPGTPGAGDMAIDSGAGNSLKYYNGSTWISLAVGGTGDFKADGSVNMTGTLKHVAGSASAPGMTFASDTDNGIFAPAADSLAIATSGAERLRVSPSGYVGIGTSSPSSLLQVYKNQANGTPYEMLTIDSGTYDSSVSGDSVSIGFKGTTYFGSIGGYGNGTTSGIGIWGGTSNASAPNLYVKSGGNVGIGTSAPGSKLSVIASAAGVPPIVAYQTDGTTMNARLGSWNGDAGGLALYNGAGTLQSVISANSSDSTYFNAGNVGIGTTSPNRLLEVAGPIRIQPGTLPASPAAGDIALDSAASNTLKFHNGTTWVTLNTGSGYAAAGANSDITSLNALTAINGASLAIGNTATTTLNLGGAATGALTTTVGSTASTSATTVQSGTGGLTLSAAGTGVVTSTRPLVVTPGSLPAGNTGGMIAFDSAASNTLKYNNGSTWTSVGNASATGTANYISKFTGTNALGNSALYDNAGNIGIGTTAAARLLQVAGALRLSPITVPASPAAGDIYIDSGASNGLKYHNGTSWVSIGSGTGDFLANGSIPMTGNLRLNNNWLSGDGGNEGVFVSSSGTVGIGTTGPSYMLDITGTPSSNANGLRAISDGGAGLSSTLLVRHSGIDFSTSQANSIPLIKITAPSLTSTNAVMQLTSNAGAREVLWASSDGSVGIGTTAPGRLLQVAGAVRFSPTTTPASPAAGDMFFDSAASNALKFYNGTAWQAINTGSGYAAAGANSDITSLNALTNINGASLAIGNTATTTLNLGGAATGALTTTVGSTASTSATTVQSGTGGLTLSAAGTGVVTSTRPLVVTPGSLPAGNTGGMIAFDSSASNTLKYNNGTTWTSVGNASATGTANYISKFTGTNALGNSALYDNAGNIGIGTTAAARLLQVAGAMRLSPAANPASPAAGDIYIDSGASNGLKYHNGTSWVSLGSGTGDFLANGTVNMTGTLKSVAGSAAAPGLTFVGDTNNGIFAPAADNFAIATSGVERLRVLSSGNVGIGTTNPARALDIAGSMRLLPAALPASPAAGDIAFDSAASNTLKFYNGTAWQSVNTGSGYAAAGANSDITSLNALTAINGASLAIGNTATTTLNLGGAATGALTTTVGSTASTSGTTVQSGTGGLTLSAAGTGVVTSTRPLVVTPGSLPAGNTGGMIAFDSSASNTLKYNNGTTWTSVGNASATGTANYISKFTGANALGNSALYDNAGNIGIGTTAAARLLQVAGAMRLSPAANPASPAAGDIYIDSGASNGLKYHNGTSWVSLGSGSGDFLANGSVPMTGNLRLNNNWLSGDGGSEGVFVTSAGKVGIGTSGSTQTLSLYEGTNSTNVELNFYGRNAAAAGRQATVGVNPDGEFFGIDWANTINNPAFVVYKTGAVGIGVTAPARLLHVAGAVRFAPTTTPASPAAGDMFFDSAASNALKFYNGTAWQAINTGSGYAAAGANSDITSLNALTNINGASLAIGNTATTTLNLGGAATGALTTTVGSTASTSATTVQSGTGGLTLSAAGTGVVTSTRPFVVTPGALPAGNTGGMIAFDSSASNTLKYNNGTTWTSVGNASATGTANYISKFTGTNALGNSALYDNAGNIGIGTTAAARLLQVAGAMRLSPAANPASPAAGDIYIDSGASNGLKYHNGTSWVSLGSGTGDFLANGTVAMTGAFRGLAGSASTPGITFANDTATGLFAPGSGILGFGTSAAEKMRILANGNVGIGSTNPTYRFEVVGSANNVTDGGLRAQNTTDGTASGAIVSVISGTSNAASGYIGAFSGSYTNTSAFADRFVVSANSDAAGVVFNANNPGQDFRWRLNAGEVMRVDSSGNVGIGTTNPARALDIAGSMRLLPAALPASPAAGDIAFDSAASNTLKFYNGTAWQSVNTGSGYAAAGANSDITSLNALTNINGASLAIGNTATTTLNLGGAATGALTTTVGSTASSSATTVQSGTGGLTLSAAGTGVVTSTRPLVVTPGALPAGNTGGMIAFDSSASNTLKYNNGTTWTSVGNASATGTANYISKFTGTNALGNSALYDNAGNIGIGTTAAARLLQVAGAMRLSPAANPASPAAGDIYIDSGASNGLKYHNGTSWVSLGSGSGDFLANGSIPMTGNLRLNNNWLSGDGGSEGVFVNSSGNVGIGTTNPTGLLSVGTSSPFTVDVNGNIITTGGLTVGSTVGVLGNSGQGYALRRNVDDQSLNIAGGNSSVTGGFIKLFGSTHATTPNVITFNNTSNESMRILANGNVGIGTTAPGRLLQVAGAVRFSPTTTPASPAAGDMFFDSAASNALKFYNGTAWQAINTGSGYAAAGANSDITSLNVLTNINGASLAIGNTATTTLNLGGAATGALTTTVGSTASTSATTVQSGTGGLTLSAAGTGVVTSTRPFVVTPGSLPAGNTGGMIAFDSAASNTLKYNNGTTWTSVGNASATGTANYISKFTGANALGNSALYDNAGNIGIGTTAAARLLQVAGAMRLSPAANPASPAAGDIYIDSGASNGLKYHNGTSWVSLGSGSGDFLANGSVQMTGNIRLNNNYLSGDGGNEGVAVTSAGYVGIGTTAPVSLFSNTNAQIADQPAVATTTSSMVWSTNANNYAAGFYNPNAGATANGVIVKVANAAGTNRLLTLNGAGTDRFVVTGNGLVGIGTTLPADTLDVRGNLYSTGSQLQFENGGIRTYFQTTGIDSNSGSLKKFGITNTGGASLGVNTNNPASTLGVNGGVSVGSYAATVAAPSNGMIVSGNVGIGTSTPARLLQVAGPIRLSPSANPGSPGAGDMYIDSGASNGLRYHNGANWITLGSGSGDFMADGSVNMTGTLKHFAGSASAPGMTFASDTDNGIFAPAADNLAIATSGVERMRVLPSGFVGIGTTNPLYNLHVMGTQSVSGALTANSGVTLPGDVNLNWSTNGESISGYAASGLTLASGGSGTNQIDFQIGGSSKVRIDSSGNLGVGLTGPARLFQVAGAMRLSPTANPASPGAGDIYIDSGAANGLKYHNGTNWVSLGSGSGDFMANGSVPMTGNLRLNNNWLSGDGGNEGVFVDSSGKVGIATSAPSSALEVAGGSRVAVGEPTGSNASAAGYSFVGDGDTGIFSSSDGVLNLWSNNLRAMSIYQDKVGIGTTQAIHRLDVRNGNINIDYNYGIRVGAASSPTGEGGDNSWASGTSKLIQTGWDGSNDFVSYYTPGASRSLPVMSMLSSGSVGIGTTAPSNALSVGADIGAASPSQNTIAVGNSTGNSMLTIGQDNSNRGRMMWVYNATPANAYLAVGSRAGSQALILQDQGGNVGIGMTNPSVALDVNGDIEYTGTITDVSDRRLKENIQPLNIGLDILRQLPVYSYTMKGDTKHKVEYGVMAQDLRELVPNLTSVIDPKNGYIGVNYIGLIPWSIRAIQEVDRDVASVKAQNEDLKVRVEKLEEQNRVLSEQVQKLIELHQKSGQ